MINNPIVYEALPERVPQGIFGLSFLSWQGNAISFAESMWMIYLIYSLIFASCVSMFIFKDRIRMYYLNNTKSVVIGMQAFGAFLLLLSTFRVFVLGFGGYPNLWELVPMHFCRIFVILIGISLVFRKLSMVKYFGMFAIGGGFMGLMIPDLSNTEYWSKFGGMEVGLDAYVFWDYFIIHSSSVILPVLLFSCVKPTIYKSEMAYTILVMWAVTLIIFGLNIALANVSDPRWRPNWFYLGIPELNGIDDLLKPYLGVMVSYPAILFTFSLIGIIFYVSFTLVYINSDRIVFIFRDAKTNMPTFKVKTIPSDNMSSFIEGPLRYRKKYNLD